MKLFKFRKVKVGEKINEAYITISYIPDIFGKTISFWFEFPRIKLLSGIDWMTNTEFVNAPHRYVILFTLRLHTRWNRVEADEISKKV